MRSDMAKVIVERPRYGSGMRGHRKGYRRQMQRIAADEQPKRERTGKTDKSFNEHLAPLRRYLFKQVGRPWSKVFAEICANLSRDSVVQDHVRDHVFDYVAVQVVEIDGVLCESTKWGPFVPLTGSWRYPRLYVCPRTGLLKRGRQPSRGRRFGEMPQLPTLHVPVDFETSFIRHKNVWQRVRLTRYSKFPPTDSVGLPVNPHDSLHRAALSRTDAVRFYGRAVYAAASRPATHGEIRKYCEPLRAPNRV